MYIDIQLETSTSPARPTDATFTKFYDELSKDWEDKADRFQARRWKRIHDRAIA